MMNSRALRMLVAGAGCVGAALVTHPAHAGGCSIWKGLACQPIFSTCAPASLGGAAPYLNCVDTLSNHWCDECIVGNGVDPRGNNGEPSNMSSALNIMPVADGARDVGPNADGHLEITVPDSWGNLVHAWQTSPSGPWSGFASYGATARGVPSQVLRNDGTVDVFFVGTDGAAWHVRQVVPNANWNAPARIGGGAFAGSIAADINTDGRVQLAGIDGSGTLWLVTETSPGSGQFAFASMGGTFRGTPAFGVNADGRLELIAIGTDGQLWHAWQDGPSGNWNSGWWTYGAGSFQGTPVVGKNLDGRLEVFVTGADLALWHVWQTAPSSGWSGWASFGGTHKFDPAVAIDADGRLEAYVVGINDGAVWRVRQTAPNAGWTTWQSLGGVVLSGPQAARNTDGTIDVFAIGQNYGVWHDRQSAPNSDSWSGWQYIGGSLQPSSF